MNLLPPSQKQELKLQKTKKLVIVLGSAVLIGLGCLGLVLLSLKFYILQDARYYEDLLAESEKVRLSPEEISLKGDIKTYNESLSAIHNFYKQQTHVNDALKVVFDIDRPNGISLAGVVIDRDVKTDALKVHVEGFAVTRDVLLAYKKNLETDPRLASVYFPPESWIASKNAEFSIVLEIKNP